MKNIFMGILKRIFNPFIMPSKQILWFGGIGLMAIPGTLLLAAPQGGVVVQGQGSISHTSTASTVINQNSQSMAIDWNSFNLANNESVTFNQPGASSIALNRITNGSPSTIFGQISANGRVILSNPNGILFGRTAQVNVGGLLATGLDINPSDFMSGKFSLDAVDGSTGYVINQGLLQAATGGSISLMGKTVKNDGLIMADYGQINLLAGESAVVDFTGDGLLNFQITDSVKQNISNENVAAENTGTLQADAGKIVIAANVAQDIFTQAVNNSGIVKATKIENVGGVIRLTGSGGNVHNSGQISATGGGNVVMKSTNKTEMTGNGSVDVSNKSGIAGFFYMLGQKVGLFDDSSVNATGRDGGGEVRIGGDIQGRGDLQNADATLMTKTTSIDASASKNGDGGSVVLWAEGAAQIHGDIAARGGSEGGNGGFIETSGKSYLNVTSIPDATATVGDGGVWLLDPADIVIDDVPADVDISESPPYNFTPTPNTTTSTLSVTNLENAIQSGQNVIVSTTNNASGTGDIKVAASILPDLNQSENYLTLNADGDITFQNGASISALVPNNNYKFNVTLNATQGNINLASAAPTAIITSGGNLTATATSFNALNIIDTNDGNIEINSDIILDGSSQFSSSNGNITLNGNVTDAAGTSTLDLSAGTGNIAVNSIDVGNLTATAGQISLAGDITTNNSDINFSAPLIVDGMRNLSTGAGAGNITLAAVDADSTNGGSLSLSSGLGDVTLNGTMGANTALTDFSIDHAGTLTMPQAVNLSGSFTQSNALGNTQLSANISAANDLVFNGALVVENDLSLSATTGNISLSAVDAGVIGGSLTLTSGANTTLTGAIGQTNQLTNLTINNGNVLTVANDIATANNLSITGSLVVDGDRSLTATTGDINLVAVDADVTNGGSLTLTSGGNTNLGGSLGQTNQLTNLTINNGNALTLASDIATANNLSITGSLVVDGDRSLTATAGDINLAAVDADATNGGSLILTSGGNTNLGGSLGQTNQLTNLTINNGNALTVANDIATASNLSITGSLIVDGDRSLSATAGDINLAAVDADATNGGSLTLTSGGNTSLGGSLGQTNQLTNLTINNGNALTVSNDIATANNLSITGALVVDGDRSLTATAGDISLAAVDADATNGGSLSLTSGGNTTLGGAVGTAQTLTNLSINQGGTLTFAQDITLDGSFVQSNAAGTTQLNKDINTTNSNISFAGAVVVDGNRSLNTGAGAGDVSLTVVDAHPVNGGSLNLSSGAGNINLSGTVGANNALTNLTIDQAGTFSFANDINLGGSFFQNNAAGTTRLTKSITAANDLTFSGVLIVENSQNLTATAGEINLAAVEADVTNGGSLSLSSGSNINLNGSLGATTALTDLNINQSGTFTFAQDIDLNGSFAQTNATGTTQLSNNLSAANNLIFNGSLVVNGNRSLNSGSNIELAEVVGNAGNVDSLTLVSNTGDVKLNNAIGAASNLDNLTINQQGLFSSAGNIDLTGKFDQNNANGSTKLDFDISADSLSFSGAVNVSGNRQLTSIGNLDLATVDALAVNNGDSLILTTSTGDVNLNGTIGSAVALDGLTINNAGQLLATKNINLNGAFQQNGAGKTIVAGDITTSSDDILFAGAVDVNGVVTFTTNGNDTTAGNIVFQQAIEAQTASSDELILNAGAANVDLMADVGATSRLNRLQINTANNVNAVDIHANTINQLSAVNSQFAMLDAGAGGINLVGGNIGLNGSVSTINSGVFSVNNSGLLSIDGVLDLDGAFSQNGNNLSSVALNKNIQTTGDDITFASVVTISNAVKLDTGINVAGDVRFAEKLDAVSTVSDSLNVVAGTGEVMFAKSVGGGQALNGLTLQSENAVFDSTVNVDSLGLDVTANTVSFNDNVATANGGNVTINNTGLLDIKNAAFIDASGSFIQNGAGVIQLGNNIRSAGSEISFVGDLLLTGDRSLRNTANGEIRLAGAVTGNHIFELSAGGDIYLSAIDVATLRFINGKDLYLSSDLSVNDSLSFAALDNIFLNNSLAISAVNTSNTTAIDFNANNVISGQHSLDLTANTVNLFQVGGTDKLTGLGVTADTLNLFSDISMNGMIDISQTNTVLNSSIQLQSTSNNAGIKLGQITGGNQSLEIINAGETQLFADINARDVDLSNATGNISLMNDLKIITSAKNGNINFTGTSVYGAAKALTLSAGTGQVSLKNIGTEAAPLSRLAIVDAGSVLLSGDIYTMQTQDYTAMNAMALNANSPAVVLNSANGDILLGTTGISGNTALNVVSQQGNVSLSDISGVTDLTLSSNGSLILSGNILASSVNMQDVGNVSLSQSVSIDTSSANGAINLQNAKVAGGNESLTLNAGTGKIALGSVGSQTTALNALSIGSTSGLSLYGDLFVKNDLSFANAGSLFLNNDAQISTSSANGTISFGAINIDGLHNLALDAGNGNIQIASVGNSEALNSLTLNTSGKVNLSGSYIINGNLLIENTNQINLDGDVFIQTAANDGNVNFSGSAVNGLSQLVINAGNGTVTMGNIGQTTNLSRLQLDASQIQTGSVSTRFDQSYTGILNLSGDLKVTDAGSIDINQLNLVTNSNIEAKKNITIKDAINGGFDLNLAAGGGDVMLEADAGQSSVLKSLTMTGGNLSVNSAFTEKNISLTAENAVAQNGDLNSSSGDISVIAKSGGVSMGASSLVTASENNKITYQSNNELILASLSGGDISLSSTTGEIKGLAISGDHINGKQVTLSALNGISALDSNAQVQALRVVVNNLSISNENNDVLVATQSGQFNNIRPEQNPLVMGQVINKNGNLNINNTGAIQFAENLSVGGAVKLVSSSQIDINKEFMAQDDIDIEVGKGTITTAKDGLNLTGNMESAKSSINLQVNDLMQLQGAVKAENGDVTVVSDNNSIALTSINAGANKAVVSAGGSIVALDSSQANISAGEVELLTGTTGVVGSFSKPLKLSTNATLVNSINAFITGNTGVIVSTGGSILDPGVAVSSANKGQSTSAQEFSFVDASVFSRELSLFDVINEGIRLPEDQLEDE